MNKVFGPARVLFAAFALFVTVGLAHAAAPLTFVANDDELNVALEAAELGTIGSIAISEQFYQGSAKQTKDRIRGLIARTFELGHRAVYIYGSPLDVDLANELLGGSIRCMNLPFAVLVVHGKTDKSACFVNDGEVMPDDTIREKLNDFEVYRFKLLPED